MERLGEYAARPIGFILGAPPSHYEIMHERYFQARQPLEDFVIAKLRAGEWTAAALEMPVTLHSERIRVPVAFWKFLQLNFTEATAEGLDLKLVEIEIEAPQPTIGPLAASSRPSDPPVDMVSPQLNLTEDNAVLTLRGEKLVFRGDVQQLILRQLVDAHSEERHLKTAEVLSKAGTQVDSIAKAFRKNRHWLKLKKIIHQEQGFVWIDLNSPP
jgi:hypothetical protein